MSDLIPLMIVPLLLVTGIASWMYSPWLLSLAALQLIIFFAYLPR
jgi:hypothetical protein